MRTLRRMLHAAREAVGRSQKQVADETGISTRTINKVERGVDPVRFNNIVALRNYYETLGVRALEADAPKSWALVFDDSIAPAPDPLRARERAFDAAPGPLLCAARVMLDLSQSDMGKQIGSSHTTIRRLERADGTTAPELAYKLQAYLEMRGFQFVKPHKGVGWILHVPAFS
ncbi:helix-turn-helix transcriptional regulator [Rhizobium sp. CB3090]|uniref:helix-turn-helix domain-containing protein n=1 Tax=Rhizobium sp. CB3090 TaxID=3039156 RepID=UPI0024B10C1E|nr:helix-turn-helix transcriptional regulator [Rhizobium sp. CB3090]WFU10928.1 helix-turn-helix transcriptional regulator [Rhizobium sp. CB3090]